MGVDPEILKEINSLADHLDVPDTDRTAFTNTILSFRRSAREIGNVGTIIKPGQRSAIHPGQAADGEIGSRSNQPHLASGPPSRDATHGITEPATAEARPNPEIVPQPVTPRPVTADELFGNVPPTLQVKAHKKYEFPVDLLDEPKALTAARRIANARNYRIKHRLPLTPEEDVQGLMANSFVNQARTRQRRKRGSQPPTVC
jgi:hypothetical protein